MPQVPRRTFLAGALAGAAAAVAACSSSTRSNATASSSAAPIPTTTPSTAAPEGTRFVSAGPRDRDQVALTFHVSGDRGLAVRLLDALRTDKVTITAFMVGTWLDQNADLASRFMEDGHELANHTYTHLTFPSLSRAEMETEVLRCRDSLQRFAGTTGAYFRPSGTSNGTDDPGATVLDVAHGAGYATVAGFDVDPSDYADPGASAVAQRTLATVQRGSIVSLHFGHPGTIDALPQIVSGLSEHGLQPVGLTALLT
jgi:peptidoglycan/xylan/chitin deacetylase (PgdA/CDA1 family)